jgi:uncharacterized membrane protein
MHALSDVGVEDGARGLNHFRQVVGYSIDAESHRCAVLWEDLLADGTWVSTILPGLGGLESEARAINNSGQIAGWSKTSSNEVRAVVWEYQGADEGWTTTVLGEAGLDSFAFGINGKGDVVGQEGGLPLLWERAEYQAPSSEPPWQPVPLPTGPRQDATGAAFGINAAGQVVGALDGDAALWLLEPAYGLPMGLFLLNDYPALLGKTAPDLHFQVAWDINDGMQIVGYGELNGETQILLLDFQGEPDCNGNGVIDMCDTPGDFDGSGFVDLADYEVLADCLDGPALLAQEYCLCLLDSDHDGDVDLNDFILLQRSFAVQ